MNAKLGIKIDRDIMNVLDSHAATDQEVQDFEHDKSINTLALFRPFFSFIKSNWNHHLADEFVSDFLESYPEHKNNDNEIAIIREHFFSRLTSLRAASSSLKPKQGESKEETEARLTRELNEELLMKRHRSRQITVRLQELIQLDI